MRRFENSIKSTRENLKECEELILKYNKKPLTDEDVNHYAKVYGFDTDDYTAEEKYLLAINRIIYWMHS